MREAADANKEKKDAAARYRNRMHGSDPSRLAGVTKEQMLKALRGEREEGPPFTGESSDREKLNEERVETVKLVLEGRE